jgi:hypothetical protein
MGAFLFARPDEIYSYNATVSIGSGTVDTTYSADSLTNGWPGKPVRMTGGALTATLTFTSGQVGVVALANTNLTANTTISGGVSGTITPATLPPNAIPLNAFTQVTPASTTTITMATSGNSANVIIGELMAGKLRTLTNAIGGTGAPRYLDIQFVDDDLPLPMDAEFGSIPPYDRGMERRTLKGTQIYTYAQLQDLRAWRQAQRSNSRPSLIIPDASINDAWVCLFRGMSYRPVASDLWEVTLEFLELPRLRW